jgi:hypothetical protein
VFDTVFGLPLHPLIVHATVVVVPAGAAAVALAAVMPRFRRWAGVLPLLLSVAGLVLIPITTASGESLEHRVEETALLQQHTRMAEGLLPWMVVLTVAAAALCWVWLGERVGRDAGWAGAASGTAASGALGSGAGARDEGRSGAGGGGDDFAAETTGPTARGAAGTRLLDRNLLDSGVLRRVGRRRPGRTVMSLIVALAVLGAAGTSVQVARIGHSGATSAWHDTVAATP